MSVVLTISVATVLIVLGIGWVIFALVRARFRRNRRIRRELKEMKRQEKLQRRSGR